MKEIYIIISIILGYLLGSIPFGIIIGKVFFHKDIREYGSHNSGGTNAGRVLGKKVGLIVIILDALKCFLAIILNLLVYKLFFKELGNNLYSICALVTGFFVALGHCFPVWSKFNGGKAVATIAGFIATINPIVFLISFTVFFSVYLLTKYVSLASMSCSIFGTILCWIPFILGSTYFPGLILGIDYTIAIPLSFTFTTALLVYRHKANIIRMINGNENKSYLFKKKK